MEADKREYSKDVVWSSDKVEENKHLWVFLGALYNTSLWFTIVWLEYEVHFWKKDQVDLPYLSLVYPLQKKFSADL